MGRALSVLVAAVGLVVLAPMLALIAAAIKLDSRGPVLFRQRRIGKDGRPFELVKFRTMRSDADQLQADLESLNEASGALFKIADDPRLTPVGRFLRRYSLDELPQLLNVLKGDMSLIGPRPLILEEDQFVESWARKRLLLKPGMTGLWQVLGRSAIPFEEMVKLDYVYVTNWSLWWDIKILLRTNPTVLARRGAY